MFKLSPYIYGEDSRTQAEFYAKALNGEIVMVKTFAEMPGASEDMKDRVMHLVLKVGDQVFYMADSNGEVQRGSGMDLTLDFSTEEEAREVFENLANGGEVLMPFERMFWGTMFGRLLDPFGVRWQISTMH